MASVLVVYGSGHGQTAKVAGHIGTTLAAQRHEVTVRHVADDSPVSIDAFDAVVVGSPVYNRTHRPEVVHFVEENRETLATRPTAFFQLSFASAVPYRWGREGAGEYVDSLVERTDWKPDRVGLFAGGVTYTEYNPLTRAFFKVFASFTTRDTDTSRDYEYTDWEAVEAFATEFGSFVEQRLTSQRSVARDSDRTLLSRVTTVGLGLGVLGIAYWLATHSHSSDGDGRRVPVVPRPPPPSQ